LLALAAGAPAGCAADRPAPAASWLQRFRPFQGAAEGDAVGMDVALVEVPVGDPFLNGGLWTFVDESAVPLEQKGVLEGKGFRAGRVGAAPSAELLDLLTAERPCPAPRRLEMHSGKAEKPLELGPPRQECRFELRRGERAEAVELAGAQCCLLVVPSLTEDGRTRLAFTPQVRHASAAAAWLPRPDRAGRCRQ